MLHEFDKSVCIEIVNTEENFKILESCEKAASLQSVVYHAYRNALEKHLPEASLLHKEFAYLKVFVRLLINREELDSVREECSERTSNCSG